MKNQMIGQCILAFMIITITSSTAQKKSLEDIPCPKAKDISDLDKVTLSKSAPRGIFALIQWGEAPELRTWKDPGLDGVTIRRYWFEFNPKRDKYKWRELDEIFAQADKFSKKIDLIVAGIVSGANGLNPGLMMKQADSIGDGTHPIALTGRVYCWADASNGSIQPGDLLTTSGTPGHAMKVVNYSVAQGAIIGKAMTALEKGKGLVLVLVSLQ